MERNVVVYRMDADLFRLDSYTFRDNIPTMILDGLAVDFATLDDEIMNG